MNTLGSFLVFIIVFFFAKTESHYNDVCPPGKIKESPTQDTCCTMGTEYYSTKLKTCKAEFSVDEDPKKVCCAELSKKGTVVHRVKNCIYLYGLLNWKLTACSDYVSAEALRLMECPPGKRMDDLYYGSCCTLGEQYFSDIYKNCEAEFLPGEDRKTECCTALSNPDNATRHRVNNCRYLYGLETWNSTACSGPPSNVLATSVTSDLTSLYEKTENVTQTTEPFTRTDTGRDLFVAPVTNENRQDYLKPFIVVLCLFGAFAIGFCVYWVHRNCERKGAARKETIAIPSTDGTPEAQSFLISDSKSSIVSINPKCGNQQRAVFYESENEINQNQRNRASQEEKDAINEMEEAREEYNRTSSRTPVI